MSLVAYDNSSDESEEETKIVKKQKESVKIRIPSLKEFEEEEEKPLAKKPKSQAGSGLLSLLPPPKNTTTLSKPGFVPHILKSRKEKPLFFPAQNKNKNAEINVTSDSSAAPEEQESDDENSSIKEKSYEESSSVPGSSDFFWLDDLASNNKVKEDDPHLSEKNSSFIQNLSSYLPSPSNSNMQQTYLNETKLVVCTEQYQQPSGIKAHEVDQHSEHGFPSEHQLSSLENYSSMNGNEPRESFLKDKEFLKLQGRRKEFEDLNIIDVNADDQLTNKNEWLMKNITEEATHRPRKKHNMPTQQQKRKHQITYLAFQAKEKEMDLKNQWALNSRTRRETQAKYGF